MAYTINEYMPHLMDPIARVEAYRDNETAAKLLSAYRECDAHIVTIADLWRTKTRWPFRPCAKSAKNQRLFGIARRQDNCILRN